MNPNADMRVKGAQVHQFNNVQMSKYPRSTFQRDFPIKTTIDVDYLVPLFVEECLPGDHKKFNVTQLLARLTTPIKPIMDNLYIETFAFFCPYRLVWQNWEKLQGQQLNPGDSTNYSVPILDKTKAPLSTTGFTAESMADYFGITTYTTNLDNISALFFRSYQKIYDDWFRDENIINSLNPPTGDGPDDPSIYTLQKRRKTKDYLTSMLPWPQKGAAVTVPLGSSADIVARTPWSGNHQIWRLISSGAAANTGDTINASSTAPFGEPRLNNITQVGLDLNDSHYVDLSTATAATINLFRSQSIYQQMLELDARAGTRYNEGIYARFGVIPQDARLQRPELVGTGRTLVNVFAVPQTGASPTTPTSTNAQGNLAAFGVAKGSGDHRFSYACQEHGVFMVIVNIRADLSYQQNVPRMFTKRTRLDFYEPLMNGMGEQPVYGSELMATGTASDNSVVGYIGRFDDYRYRQAQVTGKFRSQTPTPLDYWHLAQQFGSLPTLNQTFIEPATPMSRVVAVSTEPHFYLTAYVQYQDTKVMPIRSNPGIDVL